MQVATLAAFAGREVLTCPPTTPTRVALETMRHHAIGSIVITTDARAPLGILTLRDVLDRIVLTDGALAAPVSRFMTADPVHLSMRESPYEAARLMVRHGVRHVVLVDGGKISGIVSERDLFGMQSTGVRHLSTAIKGATSLDEVERFGREISALACQLVTQGVAIGPLTAFISSLIDLLAERIVTTELGEAADLGARVCWIVMGSEGRSEQTLLTDQDNGIIFEVAPGRDIEAVRSLLLPIARRINAALDRAGYRLCPGNIMACNPQWCLSLDEWRSRFARWIDSGSPEALLHGSVFFDLRALTGEVSLASALRGWLLDLAPRNRRFLQQMAANALRNRPAVGLLHRLVVDADGSIDLKLNAATPFIDAGRIMSLACNIDAVRTEVRLRNAGSVLNVPVHETEAWIAAFYEIQGFRLRRQAERIEQGKQPDNRASPAELHDFAQQVLKLALEQGRSLQSRLALDYGL
jgi:CBS domain-containing protein